MAVFTKLTEIIFKHDYFAGGLFTGFFVQPFSDTASYLVRRQLTFKSFPEGFCLVTEADNSAEIVTGNSRIKGDAFTLKFALFLTDNNFYNYTDGLPEDITGSLVFFRNFKNAEGFEPHPGKLHIHENVSLTDNMLRDPIAGTFLRKPFAIIELLIDDNLQHLYSIDFAVRKSIWRYIFTGPNYTGLSNPAVNSSAKFAFSGPVKISLPNKVDAICFESTEPIPHSQKSDLQFQLIDKHPTVAEKFKVIKRALPLPDQRCVSGYMGASEAAHNCSEIYIN